MKGILHIALVCLLAVFVSSCNKERVEPHNPVLNDLSVNGASAKSGTTPVPVPVDDTASPCVGHPGQGGVSEPSPTGISDDGDDIADSEKSRKKRR